MGGSLPNGAVLSILGCLVLEKPWMAVLTVPGSVLTESLRQPWAAGREWKLRGDL